MTTLRANFITGTVQESPLTSGATTLTMAGALQATPTVAAPNIVRLVIDPLGADVLAGSAREIIHVTAYTQGAGSATIARGQEGTTGVVHSHGMTIGLNSTKADWDEVIALTSTHEALTTGIHGVGASTVDSVAARTSAIGTHAGLSTGVHGVSGTIASTADIAAHNQTTGVHGVGGGTIDSVGGRDAAISSHSGLTTGIHGVAGGGNAVESTAGAASKVSIHSGMAGGVHSLLAAQTDYFYAVEADNVTAVSFTTILSQDYGDLFNDPFTMIVECMGIVGNCNTDGNQARFAIIDASSADITYGLAGLSGQVWITQHFGEFHTAAFMGKKQYSANASPGFRVQYAVSGGGNTYIDLAVHVRFLYGAL